MSNARALSQVETLAPVIRAHAEASERAARLAPEIVNAFHGAGLYRLHLPERLDGAELTIPAILPVLEAVARIDGSAGWNLAIGVAGPICAYFAARDAFEAIFRDRDAILAGSLNPAGVRITPCEGGFRFRGRARTVSACAEATWIMAAGIVMDHEQPVLVNDAPLLRAGLFAMRHCSVLDTWSMTGMRATGSHDCAFEDVFVPHAFTFAWPVPEPSWREGPHGRMPLATQLGCGVSSVAIGIAQHAIDALIELAEVKVPAGARATLRERPLAQVQLAQAAGGVRAARSYLREACETAWKWAETDQPFADAQCGAVRLAAVTATRLSLQAVDLVHEAAGMNGARLGEPIERCWRDLHTLSHHVILDAPRYETVGRVLFGLKPNTPFI